MTRYPLLVMSILLLVTSGIATAFADSVRGEMAGIVTVAAASASSASFRVEDLVGFTVTNDIRFLRGIEIEIKVPRELLPFRNGFVYCLYRSLTPAPTIGTRAYRGTLLQMDLLPMQQRVFIRVPMIKGHGLKGTADTICLSTIADIAVFPLVLTILPVNKGMPSYVSGLKFAASAKPLFSETGLLSLSISGPGRSPLASARDLTILVDDGKVAYPEKEYVLGSGIHTLTVKSPLFRTETMSFTIESGKVTTLNVILEKTGANVVIEAPDTSAIFIDGTRYDARAARALNLSEGEHSLQVTFGDYQLTRTFTVQKEKTYRISLFFEISIQEN